MSDAATTEIMATPMRSVTTAPAASAAAGGNFVRQLKGVVQQPAVAKSLPLLGLVALIGLAALIWAAMSTPAERDLFQGLPDQDKAAVAEALKGAGIDYSIDRDTGALSVPEDSYHQARMLLAAQGLPKSAPSGADMIGELPLGASRAVEGERLRGAREADLARTIEAIDAVQSARVHLAVQEQSVFLRDRAESAASVMLRLAPGRSLGDAQVKAIVHLVASSVPGLNPDDVSVVDQSGRLLSSPGGGGTTEASDRQVAIQARIEERYRQALNTLLTPLVGEGNFTAEVHADVDFSETQATREEFPKDATAVTSEENSWTAEKGADQAGGIPGALSNQPPQATQVAAQPDQQMAAEAGQTTAAPGTTSQNSSRNFAVGRQVSVTREQIGQVKRVTVAVALKNPEGGKLRSKEELTAIETLVKGAVGFDQARGDMVALSSRNFAAVEDGEAAWWQAEWVMPMVRNVTALLIAALVVFGLGRPLMKRSSAAIAKRSEAKQDAAAAPKADVGGEIAAEIADHAAANPDAKVTLEMIESAPSYEARAALIRNFVRQDPARAALVVRDLIRADVREGADADV